MRASYALENICHGGELLFGSQGIILSHFDNINTSLRS